MYLLNISAAAFAFVLSRFSKNMVTLMIKVVPAAIAAVFLSMWLLDEFLMIYIGGSILLKMLSLAVVFIAGIGASLFIARREKKIDVL